MLQMSATCYFFGFCCVVCSTFPLFDFRTFRRFAFCCTYRPFAAFRPFAFFCTFRRFAATAYFSRLFDLSGFFWRNIFSSCNFLTCRFSAFRVQFGILHLSAPRAVRKQSPGRTTCVFDSRLQRPIFQQTGICQRIHGFTMYTFRDSSSNCLCVHNRHNPAST